MVEWRKRDKNPATFLLLLRLLLIVIYDGFGMYNETIVTDWYVDNDDDDVGLYINLLVEYVIMSVPIFSHKDNYYIFIQSNYAFIGLCSGGDIYIYI